MDTDKSGATALIVIDMQRALLSGSTKPHDIDGVQERTLALIAAARAAGAQVVFVQHCSPPGTPCAQGSTGWELLDGLAPHADDWVVQKTRPSVFFGTDLRERLHQSGVKRLVLVGMKTEYCIDTSCRGAADLGFQVVLVSDGHTTMDSPVMPARSIIAHHNLTLGGPFAELVTAGQVTFT